MASTACSTRSNGGSRRVASSTRKSFSVMTISASKQRRQRERPEPAPLQPGEADEQHRVDRLAGGVQGELGPRARLRRQRRLRARGAPGCRSPPSTAWTRMRIRTGVMGAPPGGSWKSPTLTRVSPASGWWKSRLKRKRPPPRSRWTTVQRPGVSRPGSGASQRPMPPEVAGAAEHQRARLDARASAACRCRRGSPPAASRPGGRASSRRSRAARGPGRRRCAPSARRRPDRGGRCTLTGTASPGHGASGEPSEPAGLREEPAQPVHPHVHGAREGAGRARARPRRSGPGPRRAAAAQAASPSSARKSGVPASRRASPAEARRESDDGGPRRS